MNISCPGCFRAWLTVIFHLRRRGEDLACLKSATFSVVMSRKDLEYECSQLKHYSIQRMSGNVDTHCRAAHIAVAFLKVCSKPLLQEIMSTLEPA
jgi:hypothetical protein